MKPVEENPLFNAVCEGVRWWLSFDGPQSRLIRDNDGMMTITDARRIALVYNFARNLPKSDSQVQCVVNCVNEFRDHSYQTLGGRAEALAPAISALHECRKTRTRLVSGMTKLTWFVLPDRWTPFDRLAAGAVGAKHSDPLEKMRIYYNKLDCMDFLAKAARIDKLAQRTPFAGVGGARILDKLLMFAHEPDWTEKNRPISRAFFDTLPPEWQQQLNTFVGALVRDEGCQLVIGKTQ